MYANKLEGRSLCSLPNNSPLVERIKEATEEVHKIKCKISCHILSTEHEQFIFTIQSVEVVEESRRDARFHWQVDKLSHKTQLP